MNIFTRDRQIVSSPQIDEIEEAIVRFFNQIVASAEEIPRVNLIILILDKIFAFQLYKDQDIFQLLGISATLDLTMDRCFAKTIIDNSSLELKMLQGNCIKMK